MRQPQRQPSQPHGQRQHGQEVGVSEEPCFAAAAVAFCRVFAPRLPRARSFPLLLARLRSHSTALPPQFSLILKYRLCELGEQSLALGNSWTELALCLVSETPWEGGLLSHLVDTVGRRSSETTWNIFCPPAAKFVWHLKAHFLILKTIT